MKVGIFDSGMGGMTTLRALREKLPDIDFEFYADHKNNPYGEKTDEELWRIVKEIVDRFASQGVKIIIIACNTATVRCIDRLRKEYQNIKFVGTEPAIKLACDAGCSNILVLATPGTVKSERVKVLVKENEDIGRKITLFACLGLADAIEFHRDVDKKLAELLSSLKDQKFDAVVLGCTHYILVQDKIQEYFKESKMLDGNDGIVRRVEKIIELDTQK